MTSLQCIVTHDSCTSHFYSINVCNVTLSSWTDGHNATVGQLIIVSAPAWLKKWIELQDKFIFSLWQHQTSQSDLGCSVVLKPDYKPVA